MKICLCCIGKMENEYIREYVEYYNKLGVDKIFLYDNNSINGEEFQDVINDYIDNNFVEVIDYRGKKICQLEAYQDCYNKNNLDYDWLMFFDCDEFLTLTEDKTLQEYLSRDCFNEYDMIHINWMMYGDNDLIGNESNERSCLKRFVTPLPYDIKGFDFWYEGYENNHVKSIIRGKKEVDWRNAWCPHTPNSDLKCCDNKGNICDAKTPFNNYDFSLSYIKHFATKTIVEWKNKMKRGYCDQSSLSASQNLTFERFFTINKKTEEKLKITKNIIDWGKHFDKIYCIHMAEMKDREEKIKNELERVGIEVNSNYFSFKITTNNPMQELIYSNPNFKHAQETCINRGVLNCTMAHYEILKEAQIMGYKRILILEDDIVFLKNLFLMKDIIENTPNTDIVLYDKWTFKKEHYLTLVKQYRINNFFSFFFKYFSSCACYSLNDIAINKIIESQEKFFLPQDWCINGDITPTLTKSFSIINLGIQKQYKTSQVDIEYNKNAYKGIIKKELYNL